MIVLALGDAFSGISLIGPWESIENAQQYGEDSGMAWNVVQMEPPPGNADSDDPDLYLPDDRTALTGPNVPIHQLGG